MSPFAITSLAAKEIYRKAIPDFIRLGWSRRRAERQARDWGIGYRTEDMRRDWADFQGYFLKEELVRKWPTDKLPTPYVMREVDLKGIARYRVWAEEIYEDKYTGRTERSMITMYDDERRLPDEWERMYLEREAEDPTAPRKINRRLEFRQFEHQKGVRY